MFSFLRTPDLRTPAAATSRVVEQAGLPADISRQCCRQVLAVRERQRSQIAELGAPAEHGAW
jgi:hypothetical protein